MTTEFRIIKVYNEDDCDKKLSLQEVYLDEDGCMVAHSIDNLIDGNNIAEMEEKINDMVSAFTKPILIEFKGRDYDGLE